MSIDDVLNWQRKQKFSASGRYQIIRKTLLGLKKELKLTGKEMFNEDMQDRMALRLLDRRGFQKFLDGKISINAMMVNLSKEWASFPVPKRMRGRHRMVNKGETYYANGS